MVLVHRRARRDLTLTPKPEGGLRLTGGPAMIGEWGKWSSKLRRCSWYLRRRLRWSESLGGLGYCRRHSGDQLGFYGLNWYGGVVEELQREEVSEMEWLVESGVAGLNRRSLATMAPGWYWPGVVLQ